MENIIRYTIRHMHMYQMIIKEAAISDDVRATGIDKSFLVRFIWYHQLKPRTQTLDRTANFCIRARQTNREDKQTDTLYEPAFTRTDQNIWFVITGMHDTPRFFQGVRNYIEKSQFHLLASFFESVIHLITIHWNNRTGYIDPESLTMGYMKEITAQRDQLIVY